jgi:hypothetical protein
LLFLGEILVGDSKLTLEEVCGRSVAPFLRRQVFANEKGGQLIGHLLDGIRVGPDIRDRESICGSLPLTLRFERLDADMTAHQFDQLLGAEALPLLWIQVESEKDLQKSRTRKHVVGHRPERLIEVRRTIRHNITLGYLLLLDENGGFRFVAIWEQERAYCGH